MAEVAAAEEVHPNTVRNWMRNGLNPIDDRRPLLFWGGDLKAFLAGRSKARKRPCPHGKMYCLTCQAPRAPAARLVDWHPSDAGAHRLAALCERCGGLMHRFIKPAAIPDFCAGLDVKKQPPTND